MASVIGLPRRLAASVAGSIDVAGELPAFQRELLDHLRSIDAGIQILTEAIVPMRDDIAGLQRSVDGRAIPDLADLRATVTRLEGLVAHIDDQIPDPDSPTALSKAKDAILGPGPAEADAS